MAGHIMAGEIHHRLFGRTKDPAVAAFRSPFADPLREIEAVADIAEELLKCMEVPQPFPGLPVLEIADFSASDCSGVIGPLRCSRSATSQSRNHASPRSPDSVASGFNPVGRPARISA